MSYGATDGVERAVDAVSLLDDEQAVFRSDVGREDILNIVRCTLDAAVDRSEITEAIMARWLKFAQDGTQQTTREFAEQFTDAVVATIVGDHA